MGLCQIKRNFLYSKEKERIKKQSTEWEKIFDRYYDRGPISRILKRAHKLISLNKWLNKKMGKCTEQRYLEKEVQMTDKYMKKFNILKYKRTADRTTLRFCVISIQMTIIKNTKISEYW